MSTQVLFLAPSCCTECNPNPNPVCFLSFLLFFSSLSRFQVPTNPSYVPGRFLGYTDRMSLPQRIKNVLTHLLQELVQSSLTSMYHRLKIKHNIKPEVHMSDSIQQARLWFFNTNYPLEFPRPLHPNTIMAAPLFRGTKTKERVSCFLFERRCNNLLEILP